MHLTELSEARRPHKTMTSDASTTEMKGAVAKAADKRSDVPKVIRQHSKETMAANGKVAEIKAGKLKVTKGVPTTRTVDKKEGVTAAKPKEAAKVAVTKAASTTVSSRARELQDMTKAEKPRATGPKTSYRVQKRLRDLSESSSDEDVSLACRRRVAPGATPRAGARGTTSRSELFEEASVEKITHAAKSCETLPERSTSVVRAAASASSTEIAARGWEKVRSAAMTPRAIQSTSRVELPSEGARS